MVLENVAILIQYTKKSLKICSSALANKTDEDKLLWLSAISVHISNFQK
jgi:hypothetical protein